MDFAKNLLMKYGWKEGQGIGKNEDGILKPIKANLKFDTSGLSFDRAQEFTDHWWERAFNTAADNLSVDSSIGKVLLSIKDDEATEISTSSYSVKKMKDQAKKNKNSYEGCFGKSNTNDNTERNAQMEIKTITDEDIMRACNGRTAHKGARHGLSLSGKLSRIEAQDQQMLQRSVINTETAPAIFKDWIQVKKKKKRNSKQIKHMHTINDELSSIDTMTNSKNLTDSLESNKSSDAPLVDEDYQIKYKSKKHKKLQRDRDEDLAQSFSTLGSKDAGESSLHPAHDIGLSANSRLIKKENRAKARKSKSDANAIEVIKQVKEQKRRENEKTNNDIGYTSSENSDSDIQDDPLINQISDAIRKRPDKKFKILAKELTAIQKKKLKKSGLSIEFKARKKDKKKLNKELAKVSKISRKIESSMCLNN